MRVAAGARDTGVSISAAGETDDRGETDESKPPHKGMRFRRGVAWPHGKCAERIAAPVRQLT